MFSLFRKVETTRDTATDVVTHERWWKNGKLDRKDGPAVIERDATTGNVTYEASCKAATGIVTRESWRKNGTYDRADGPAEIWRDAATGIVTHEAWFKDGKRDRTDGPAIIWRDATTGTVTNEAWWKDDKWIKRPVRPNAPEETLCPNVPKAGRYADLNL
jgi:hypothetical protein